MLLLEPVKIFRPFTAEKGELVDAYAANPPYYRRTCK